jgi:MFS family permease
VTGVQTCALPILLVSTEILSLFYLALIFSGTGQAVLRVVLTSQAAAASDPSRKGETMGILASLMAAYMVMAPILAGYLFEFHRSLPYLLSAVLLFIGVYFIYRFKIQATGAAESGRKEFIS